MDYKKLLVVLGALLFVSLSVWLIFAIVSGRLDLTASKTPVAGLDICASSVRTDSGQIIDVNSLKDSLEEYLYDYNNCRLNNIKVSLWGSQAKEWSGSKTAKPSQFVYLKFETGKVKYNDLTTEIKKPELGKGFAWDFVKSTAVPSNLFDVRRGRVLCSFWIDFDKCPDQSKIVETPDPVKPSATVSPEDWRIVTTPVPTATTCISAGHNRTVCQPVTN